MRITTPKPWPELTLPTAEQWLKWFQACTPDEQLYLAARVLDDMIAATNCFAAGHEHLRAELHHLDDLLQDAYRRSNRHRAAWYSARRRGWWLVKRRVDALEVGRR